MRSTADSPAAVLPLPGFALFGALGMLGLAVALRRREAPAELAIFVLVYSLSVALFFVFSRYRLPLVGPLAIFAAYLLVLGRDNLPGRGWTGLAAGCSGLGVLLVPPLFVTPESGTALAVLSRAEAGVGALSAISSLVYGPAKLLYAITGTIIGGMAWGLSGGDGQVLHAVVTPAVRGDYVVTLGERSTVEPGAGDGLPTLEADVGALTRLWFGVRPASVLTVTDPLRGSEELLDALDRKITLPSPVAGMEY